MSITYIFGRHACEAALHAHQIKKAYVLPSQEVFFLRLLAAAEKTLEVSVTDRRTLDKLANSTAHQGIVLAVEGNFAYEEKDLPRFIENISAFTQILVLDGVQDPHNLGACLRLAAAFDVACIIAPKQRAVGLTPAVYKVACGAADLIPFFPITNIVRTLSFLKEANFWVYGLTHAEGLAPVYSADFKRNVALVAGGESSGLRQLTTKACDVLYTIPMSGKIESLNVSTAVSIALAESYYQRQQV